MSYLCVHQGNLERANLAAGFIGFQNVTVVENFKNLRDRLPSQCRGTPQIAGNIGVLCDTMRQNEYRPPSLYLSAFQGELLFRYGCLTRIRT
jgi:hypothetical protein